MGAAAPRLIFILRHNLRLLPPSFSSHFRHHHRAIISSISSLNHSPSPSLTPKPKASQLFHTHPSSSLGGNHPWPEFSRFLAHISSAGYNSAIPPTDSFLPPAELSQTEVSSCLAFARDRPNLLSSENQAMMVSKVLLQRKLFRFLQLSSPSLCSFSSSFTNSGYPFHSVEATEIVGHSTSFRSFCSQKSNLFVESHGPAPIDYSSLLLEAEFHRLAESTIQGLQEKFEDYGDSIDLDGFDIDYGNDVLTVKLGELGTYVLNKQTPNRQLWLSSPVSGPSRFDWDQDTKAWIYRRNKATLYKILEDELEQLCGKPIVLS